MEWGCILTKRENGKGTLLLLPGIVERNYYFVRDALGGVRVRSGRRHVTRVGCELLSSLVGPLLGERIAIERPFYFAIFERDEPRAAGGLLDL